MLRTGISFFPIDAVTVHRRSPIDTNTISFRCYYVTRALIDIYSNKSPEIIGYYLLPRKLSSTLILRFAALLGSRSRSLFVCLTPLNGKPLEPFALHQVRRIYMPVLLLLIHLLSDTFHSISPPPQHTKSGEGNVEPLHVTRLILSWLG